MTENIIESGTVQRDRFISDIEEGEDLGTVAFSLTPEFVTLYLEGIGEPERELFRSEQIVPPTMMHVAKLRLLTARFPAGPGKHARMHYRFDCRFHSVAHVGERVHVSGVCSRRYIKRDRPYIELELAVRGDDRRLIWSSTDTSLLKLAIDAH